MKHRLVCLLVVSTSALAFVGDAVAGKVPHHWKPWA